MAQGGLCGVGMEQRWNWGSVGWHRGGIRGTEVAWGVCGEWGWHRGGIRGTEVVLGVCRVHGVAQKWP